MAEENDQRGLAAAMKELGYSCSSDRVVFGNLIRRCPPPDEAAVAEVLGLLARTHTGLASDHLGLSASGPDAASSRWNWEVVVDCIREQRPELSWALVAEALDHEGFLVPDAPGFALLSAAYRRGAGSVQLPLRAAVGRAWRHAAGQLSLLRQATLAPPDVYSFEGAERKLPQVEGLQGGRSSTGTPNQAWLCIDLLEVLRVHTDAGHFAAVRAILEQPAKSCPEVLILGIASMPGEWGLMQREVCGALLPVYLGNASPNSALMLSKLWATNQELVLEVLVEYYSHDPTRITRILEICQDLQALPLILDSSPHPFALELAATASSQDALNLEKWLGEHLSRDVGAAGAFLQAVIGFLDAKTQDPPPGSLLPGPKVPLSQDAARTLLRLLQQASSAGALPAELLTELQRVQQQCIKRFPPLAPMVTQGAEQFASDVEEEANSYFQKIYSEQKPIEEVVAMLQQFKSSSVARDQEVFACMIHNLFDEYRFFPRYPEKELHITALLFGALVQHQLVSSITLGVALRYVLDALKRPPGSKMFGFGVDALRQFAPSVHLWPPFCAQVLQIYAIQEADPELYKRLEAAVRDQQAGASTADGAAGAGAGAAPGGGAQGGSLPFLGLPVTAHASSSSEPRHLFDAPMEASTPKDADVRQGPPGAAGPWQQLPPVGAGAGAGDEGASGPPPGGWQGGGPVGAGKKDGEEDGKVGAPGQGAGGGGPPGAVGQPARGNFPGGALGGLPGAANGGAGAAQAAAALQAQQQQQQQQQSPPQPSSSPAAGAGPGGGGASTASLVLPGRIDSSVDMLLDDKDVGSLAAQVASSSLMPAGKDAPSLTALVNTESLESAAEKYQDFKEPPAAALDRLHFIMNNLSMNNVDAKVNDIKDKVFPDYAAWFANYMVVRRAAQEANYHGLYIALCDKLNEKELYRLLIKTTLYYVKILLYSERTVKESNDRALLKNLGVWLGLLTFAKNKPVLSKELELKQIIVEAYQRGRLIAVLPFMQKLLECCKESKVFKPSNPMISGILSLLAELHSLKGLKINNAFCIELVFKAFNVTAEDVKPTDLLRMLPRERQCNPDWGMENLGAEAENTTPLPMAPGAAGNAQQQQQQQHAAGGPGAMGDKAGPTGGPPGGQMPGGPAPGPGAAAVSATAAVRASLPPLVPHGQDPSKAVSGGMADGAGPHGGLPMGPPGPGQVPGGAGVGVGAGGVGVAPHQSMEQSLIGNLHSFIIISPQLAQLSDRLQLKRNVPAAVERAIQEILTPVVERSVTIACYTTVELLMKDFAMDPDEARMRSAAHLMVSTLAGSLALVTCKDPLRVSLTNALKAQLQQPAATVQGLAPDMVERIVGLLAQDNLDLGCSVIERAATDKAMRDVDKLLQPCYDERVKARMQGKTFSDTSSFHGRFPQSLPESLRLRPGQVNPQMLRVYDDFTRTPRLAPPMAAFAGGPPGTAAAALQQQQQAAAQQQVAQQRMGTPGEGGLVGTPGVGVPGVDKGPMGQQGQQQGPVGVGGPPGLGVGLGGVGGVGVAGVGAAGMQLHPAVADAAYLERYLLWQGRADAAIQVKESEGPGSDQTHLQQLLQELSLAVSDAGPAAEDVAMFFARRLLKHLWEGGSKLHTTFYVACLEALTLSPGGKRLPEELAKLVADEDGRVVKEVVEMLVRARLLALPELDAGLSKLLAAGKNLQHVSELLLHLGKTCIIRDQALSYQDLAKSLDTLHSLAARSQGNEGIIAAIDQARKASQLASMAVRPQSEIPSVVRDKADPAGMRDQVIQLFEEWLRVLASGPDEKLVQNYLVGLRSSGLLEADDTTDRFFRIMVELTVVHALGNVDAASPNPRPEAPLVPVAIDGMVRLVASIVSHGGGEPFLSRFLGILVGVLKRDADAQGTLFNARPYMRILAGLMADLGSPDVLEAPWGGLRFLKAIGLALYSLQPISVPGFSFAWLELVSHRTFMPKLLAAPHSQGAQLYEALLLSLLKFLEPYLRVADLSDSVRSMYKGTLRLLLVLLHDFPEFLCEHHHTLCDVIPTSCIQMRNLILSAFPRNMRLPDPFTPNLKVDLLPEVAQAPALFPEPERLLPEQLQGPVDTFLRTRAPASLPQDLAKRLLLLPAEAKAAGSMYNVPAVNALVLYVGSSAKSVSHPLHAPAMELYLRLVTELDSEGRYLLLNAIANQLRYPNSHTHYFSCVLLTLFAEVKSDAIKEQITRVLLERLIVNRPHPWGLLITFIELIKNARYNFWAHEFTRCAPDIERLFKSVANSCMGPMKGEQLGAAGGQGAQGAGGQGAAAGDDGAAGAAAASGTGGAGMAVAKEAAVRG